MHRILKITENPKITGVSTAFLQDLGPDFKFRGEAHDFYELVCVTEGAISVAADDKYFTLKKGQAILHPPMQFHNITSMGDKKSSIAVFSFSGENIPNLQDKVLEIGDISKTKSLLELAKKHFVIRYRFSIKEPKSTGISHLLYVKRLELFLLELVNNNQEKNEALPQSAENYSFIIKTLNDNIDKRLSIAEIASLCNMSAINLQKTFSKYAGIGIIEYFNQLKMQKAIELLERGMSVKQTALLLGFHDQNYFSTVFKRITGNTPSNILAKKSF
ncbi:MAG: AraC family transcriptional regulator [Clostridia bacterium]|nr:AraC family transcriptional regulator [Clostridia bacterium]